ncbi:hypothetical protein [Streptomyces sp. NPDC051364]|uniref:type II toxin-antitoxin system RelE family toxin n=1 Tax=Streptomyces sp. NPDC051364 TaxID=3155799 RepID=UPI0034231A42
MSGNDQPAFGLTFDPRALTDLLQAPSDIRDLALAKLQDVVNANLFGGKLTHELDGLRKVYVDSRSAWRIVYATRRAPEGSAFRTEIHVVAVRPREQSDVYRTAAARLGIKRRPVDALTHAARGRSPQLDTTRTTPKPGPPPYALPGLPQPALPLTPKGPVR